MGKHVAATRCQGCNGSARSIHAAACHHGGSVALVHLILLRSAAHYLGIDYRLADLMASQTVQALLSLAWGASAFAVMRIAARTARRRVWWIGALLYGIVVAKLFLVDLANGGSIARVVSFVGVGLLLLLVGYLAPYPKAQQAASMAASA